jgi:hypothetical protein
MSVARLRGVSERWPPGARLRSRVLPPIASAGLRASAPGGRARKHGEEGRDPSLQDVLSPTLLTGWLRRLTAATKRRSALVSAARRGSF